MTIVVSFKTCSVCNDTHVMELRGENVSCTRCPVPCDACRGRRNGVPWAYCETTPCDCGCHRPSVQLLEGCDQNGVPFVEVYRNRRFIYSFIIDVDTGDEDRRRIDRDLPPRWETE